MLTELDALEISLLEKVQRLNEVGIALSAESDLRKILEKIILGAKFLTSADGGTLYTVTSDKKLRFEIISSDSLQLHFDSASGKEGIYPDIPLFVEGLPNEKTIVTYAVLHDKVVNIHDAYYETGFDFSGPRRFDEMTGYRTKSVIAIPIKSHEGEIVAVLQLINAFDPRTRKIIPFSTDNQSLAESLSSEAGIAITNRRLINDLKMLFESLVKVIASAIDEKSPSTGHHSRRVPILAEMIARAVNETRQGPFKEIVFSESEIFELKVAALLHDCGKITTPVHVVEKHSKLETITDRIELVKTRFEVLKRDAKIAALEKKLKVYELPAYQNPENQKVFDQIDDEYERVYGALNLEEQFIEACNHAPSTSLENAARIKKSATHLWKLKDEYVPLLTPDEIENLTIPFGNLTDEERKIIENHVVLTMKMLSKIPFPKNLRNVQEIAGSHHERVDGKGYPRGLTKDQLLLQARILMIADIFEALSAPDRPYKVALPLSEIYQILQDKVQTGHLDPDLVDIFMKQNVGLKYAKEHLAPQQIDINY